MTKRDTIAFVSAWLLAATLLVPSIGLAGWTLDSEQSQLHYLSVKVKTSGTGIIEHNRFARLSGTLDDSGNAEVKVDLTSVQTGVSSRDERMQKYVFNTATQPNAVLTARLSAAAMAPGSRTLKIAVKVSMNGQAKTLDVPAHVSVTDTLIKVTPTDVVLLDATDFAMDGGLKKLTGLVELAHIPVTVPVSFALTFIKQ